MAAVDPLFAQWLQSACLWAVSEDAALAARWGADALTTERITTIATKAAAEAEALRQLEFAGAPSVIDEATLPGQWLPYLGRVITIQINKLGYAAGVPVFIIGVSDDRSTGLSTVTVLRRLGDPAVPVDPEEPVDPGEPEAGAMNFALPANSGLIAVLEDF